MSSFTRGPQVRLSTGLVDVHLFNDRSRVQLSDNNRQAFLLHLLSLSLSLSLYFQIIEMWAPNHEFVNTILQYKGKCIGFWLTLQNIFMFLFLGNGAQEVSRQFGDKTINRM